MKPHFAVSDRIKGTFLVILTAVLWGISGVCAQLMYAETDVSTGELITARLILSGVMLLSVSFAKSRKDTLLVWKTPGDALDMLFFSIVGTFGVQYTFFEAIRFSNSPTASILQYVYPIIVIVMTAVFQKKLPEAHKTLAVATAVTGTVLIATDGHFGSLSISPKALGWGLTSACCIAFYTLRSERIMKRFGSECVNGWGMTVGGIAALIFTVPKNHIYVPDLKGGLLILVIAVLGTAIPFCTYLAGIKLIGSVAASALCSFETLTAAVLSAIFFGVRFSPAQTAGMALVLCTAVIPAVASRLRHKTNCA